MNHIVVDAALREARGYAKWWTYSVEDHGSSIRIVVLAFLGAAARLAEERWQPSPQEFAGHAQSAFEVATRDGNTHEVDDAVATRGVPVTYDEAVAVMATDFAQNVFNHQHGFGLRSEREHMGALLVVDILLQVAAEYAAQGWKSSAEGFRGLAESSMAHHRAQTRIKERRRKQSEA